MDKKKSPLKDKPLRLAGQSVQEQLDKLIDDKFMYYAMVAVMLIVLILFEWYRWHKELLPNPYIFTIITAPIVIFCFYKMFSLREQIQHIKQGRDGERAVGQELEKLRSQDCMVFHDIVADNFNIDHVVISEKGIFLVETKTYSKPNKEKPTVHYKKGILRIDGIGEKNKIINQVNAATAWLKQTLLESTGKKFNVKGVILFPGWWVDSDHSNDIWVLSAKGFPKFIDGAKEKLTREDKKLAAYHLSRYIRAL